MIQLDLFFQLNDFGFGIKNLVSNNKIDLLLGNSDIDLRSREELYRLLMTSK